MTRSYTQFKEYWAPEFYLPHYIQNEHILDKLENVQLLKDLTTLVKDGPGGWNISTADYCHDGIPFLGVSDIHHGIDFQNKEPTRITQQKHEELTKTQLKPSDVLLSVRGTVGITTVVPEDIGDCNISASLVRIVLTEDVLPEYLSAFLITKFGRLQIQRFADKAAQPDVNLTEVRSLRIPVPSKITQKKIKSLISRHQKRCAVKVKQSYDIREQAREFVLTALGIKWSDGTFYKSYPINYVDIESRHDAQYYNPERFEAQKSVRRSSFEVMNLDELAAVRIENMNEFSISESIPCIGLANIESNTGEIIDTETSQFSQTADSVSVFRKGDVLYGRLRPYLNKVFFIRNFASGLCSNEFVVLVPQSKINSEYLSLFLRSKVVVAQTKHMVSGNTHPRVSVNDLLQIEIPVPEMEYQVTIVNHIQDLHLKARKYQESINKDIDRTANLVERIILG